MQALAPASESSLQLCRAAGAQLPNGDDTELAEPAFHDPADAVQLCDRQWREKRLYLCRANDELAVGLAPVRGNLGQELVRRDTRRCGQPRFVPYRLSNRQRHRGCAGQRQPVFGDVQVGLVQGQRFHQVGMAQEDLAHLPGRRAVAVEVGRDEDRRRTQALGADGRHGRADAELARLVGRRADHRARTAPGNHHRLAAQTGIVPLFHRSIERVHVDVHDLPHARIMRG